MAGPDNFRLFFIAQIADRAEQSLARLVKNAGAKCKISVKQCFEKMRIETFYKFLT